MIYLQLFTEFFKTGLFAIGGGLATLPFLYDIADRYPWFDHDMLLNMVAVGESTPGPIGVNIATYAGYTSTGILGGIIATFGLVLPSYIVLVIIAKFLAKFSNDKRVQAVFYGIRPAAAGMIAASCYSMAKTTLFHFEMLGIASPLEIINIPAIILFIAIYWLNKKYKKHPIVYIASAAVIGILFKL